MSHHSLTLFGAEFICNPDDFKYLAEANKLPSSVNILIKGPCQKYRKGPNELP